MTLPLIRNNDELFQNKDIDAVFIATSDFQHATHTIEAVRRAKILIQRNLWLKLWRITGLC